MLVKFVAVKLVVVFAMSVEFATKLSVELCHLVTDPVLPLSVIVVEFVPVQTAADVEVPIFASPPTEAGSTVTVATAEFADAHTPLVTTAL